MSGTTQARLATVAAACILAITIAGGLFVFWLDRAVLYGNDDVLWILFTATASAYVVAGVAIIRNARATVIGWLCLGTAAALQASITLSTYGIYVIVVKPGSLPVPGLLLAIAEPLPLVCLGGLILIGHVFPDGHAVGRRWRPLVAATIAALFLAGAHILTPHTIREVWSDELSHAGASAVDPLGIGALAGPLRVLAPVGSALFAAGAIGAVVSLFVRRRHATPEQRQQIKWLAAVAGAAAAWIVLVLPIALATAPGGNGPAGAVFWLVITPLVSLGPPVSIGIAILRYRLYDIDVVIRKTVVFALLAAFITTVYAGIVSLVALRFEGSQAGSFLAAVTLAVVFAPARDRARRIADRLVYGKRATPYEVLATFSDQVGGAYADEDVLHRMAQVLREGTGASGARVLLRVGQEDRQAAVAGEVGAGETLVTVSHQGQDLGALAVSMPPADPMNPAKQALVEDLAAQAGLVLRNVKLIEELKASRQRLVAAQDEERRKLERNIHDGAQQQLVALAVKQRLALTLVDRDPDKAKAMLSQLQEETSDALENLRDLARGIYPPLLADKGLEAALEAQARKAAVPTTVEADGIGRYPQQIEAAVYFSVLEALQNVAKYAQATRARIALSNGRAELSFAVADDGEGFDTSTTSYGTGLQGIADRLAAIGGELQVESAPGAGTKVIGRIPVGAPR